MIEEGTAFLYCRGRRAPRAARDTPPPGNQLAPVVSRWIPSSWAMRIYDQPWRFKCNTEWTFDITCRFYIVHFPCGSAGRTFRWCVYCTKLEPISKTNDVARAERVVVLTKIVRYENRPATASLHSATPKRKNVPCFLDLAGVEFLLKKERIFFFGVLHSKYSGSVAGRNAIRTRQSKILSSRKNSFCFASEFVSAAQEGAGGMHGGFLRVWKKKRLCGFLHRACWVE